MAKKKRFDLDDDDPYMKKLKDKQTKEKRFGSSFLPPEVSDNNASLINIEDLYEAPDQWNFYSPLDDDKMSELIESIVANGLLVPIIIWNNEPEKYMVLAGHNRVRAYKLLYKITGDEKYKKISSIIKSKEEITEQEARQIIIDTNWVQRELSTIEKAKSIMSKYTLVLESGIELEGKPIRDYIAEEFELTGRQVEKYYKLNNLIDQFIEWVNSGKININAASRLSTFKPIIQEWLFNEFEEDLDNKVIMTINSKMGRVEIKNTIKAYLEQIVVYKSVKVSVQEEDYNNFLKDFKSWLKTTKYKYRT